MAEILETAPSPLASVDVDPVTLDIIENALRNARYEMDEVLFRTALSPGIREQHDEFPLIGDPSGRMVVGQFGLSIPALLAAGTLQVVDEYDNISTGVGWPATIVATVVSFCVAYAAVSWLLRFIARHSYTIFIVYRIVVGSIVLTLVATGVVAAT